MICHALNRLDIKRANLWTSTYSHFFSFVFFYSDRGVFFRFYWNLVCCLIYIWLCSVVRNVTWDSSLHIRRCLQDFPRDCSLTTRLATVATRRGGNSDEISTERKKKQPQVVLSDIEALHVTLRHVWFVYIFQFFKIHILKNLSVFGSRCVCRYLSKHLIFAKLSISVAIPNKLEENDSNATHPILVIILFH